MNARNPYTQSQLDLLSRIERTTQSRELRNDVRALRAERESAARGRREVVKSGNRVVGFTRNENNH